MAAITKKALESWIALESSSRANKTINEIMIIQRGVFKGAKADNIRRESPIDATEDLPQPMLTGSIAK